MFYCRDVASRSDFAKTTKLQAFIGEEIGEGTTVLRHPPPFGTFFSGFHERILFFSIFAPLLCLAPPFEFLCTPLQAFETCCLARDSLTKPNATDTEHQEGSTRNPYCPLWANKKKSTGYPSRVLGLKLPLATFGIHNCFATKIPTL